MITLIWRAASIVETADEDVLEKIPSEFEGYPVEVLVTGEIRALD